MPETLELRPMVARFAQEMERKLRENDHKGGWSVSKTAYLFDRLREETEELRRALESYWYLVKNHPSANLSEAERFVVNEAADVGNFAAMIADVTSWSAPVRQVATPVTTPSGISEPIGTMLSDGGMVVMVACEKCAAERHVIAPGKSIQYGKTNAERGDSVKKIMFEHYRLQHPGVPLPT